MENNNLHLLDRIKNLDVSTIENMSPDVMAIITDNFNESLVRNVLYIGETNTEQRRIIRCIKNKYRIWKQARDNYWGKHPLFEVYPKYLSELQMDIECGMVVTVDGSVPESELYPLIKVSTLGAVSQKLKGIDEETIAKDNNPDLIAIVEEKDKRIAELEAKVNQLSEQIANLSITQEEFDEIFSDWGNPSNEEKGSKGDTITSPQTPQNNSIGELKAKLTRQEGQLVEANNINAQQAARIKELEEEVGILKKQKETWVVELFSHFCYEDMQDAKDIIDEMRDKSDPEIADIIFERKKANIISSKTTNIDMWRVLHAAKIYESDSYQNLDTALRRRKKRKQ